MDSQNTTDVVQVHNPNGKSPILLVCEHASNHIPIPFSGLGLSASDQRSHAAWDPGALAVSSELSQALDAKLVASGISRLVYDCNRPPEASDAMPEHSEVIDIPGNKGLSEVNKSARVQTYYKPFQSALAKTVSTTKDPILVTIHSFTPVYHGQNRAVEIGVLHDADTRLADAMLRHKSRFDCYQTERNEPYGPAQGVTHTLKEHGLAHGHLNVMLEIRNDLIATSKAQSEMATVLATWLQMALADLGRRVTVQ